MKVTATAKPASHAKPAKAKKQKAKKARSKAGASKKHVPTTAHQKHAAHEAHLKHEAHVAAGKARGLSLAEGVACCSAEALAASLRLAGGTVSDDDVLELHWRARGTEDEGVSILAALEAASVFGLTGYRPVFAERPLDDLPLPFGQLLGHVKDVDLGEVDHGLGEGLIHGLILGVELPGPHAVLAEPGRWWSWGERYDPSAFPDAVIEEAWAVSWS